MVRHLQRLYPDIKFYPAREGATRVNMKAIQLQYVYESLRDMNYKAEVPEGNKE